MLHKWKCILTNWINCYFNDNKIEQCVNLECMLNIISHLRENLNLDESKSSSLEAHTIEEFINEKYPEFKFENGTVEANTEEDLYLVASLLLFFVCVNSKDVDIKNAMCSKLSLEDQETILKFSKCLLDCSPVTYRDVHSAIIEACGQEVARSSSARTVAETPPALRSLHGEVRRLQAALDAERFDRNYLQEELSRNNLRLEKLLKEKEQYKLEIVNLKARIELCCGEQAEARDTQSGGDVSAKLMRQLQDIEERLVDTQAQLDDAQYQRDAYKARIEELKQERDKWLSVSQQESSRAILLADDLETERKHTQSLRELVAELRQHNQRNGLDSSQLECDDPDASIHSLHNSSVCSEVCANVVEVQLGEERAKIVVLKQQIQGLQDQLNQLNQKYETEKETLHEIIVEKDTDIFNLKHRINEEIEEKQMMKIQCGDEISQLNNEMNEIEQKLKNTRLLLDGKVQEIQTLQEEKLSLLQSLTNETTKFENIIKDLKTEIDSEKASKAQMKEDYENHIMKVNEKILNRNNELVELQNNIFDKSENIERLHLELRKEREFKDQLINKHHNDITELCNQRTGLEAKLHEKCEESRSLQQTLEQKNAFIEDMRKEIDNLKTSVSSLEDNCRSLEDTKAALLNEIQNKDVQLEEINKYVENLKNMLSEEKEKYEHDLDERNAIINTLQMQLHNEIQFKLGLQNELTQLQTLRTTLIEEVNKLNVEWSKLQKEVQEKDKTIDAMDLYLKEEKHTTEKLKADCNKLNENLRKMSKEISKKDHELKAIENELESERMSFKEQIHKKDEIIQSLNNKASSENTEKTALFNELKAVVEEKTKLSLEVQEKCEKVSQLQKDCDNFNQMREENNKVVLELQHLLEDLKSKYSALEKTFDEETSKLMRKLNEAEKNVKDLTTKSRNAVHDRDLQIETLNMEVGKLQKAFETDRENINLIQKEKEALIKKVNDEILFKNKFEKEYQNQCMVLKNVTTQLNEEIIAKNNEISSLNKKLEAHLQTVQKKSQDIKLLEEKLKETTTSSKKLEENKNAEVKDYCTKIEELKSLNKESETQLKVEIDTKLQTIQVLQKEIKELRLTIEENNKNHEKIYKEKDSVIENLEDQLKVVSAQLDSIQEDFTNKTQVWEKSKEGMIEKLHTKDNEISKLKEHAEQLQESLELNLKQAEKVKAELTACIEMLTKERDTAKQNTEESVKALKEKIQEEENKYVDSEAMKTCLTEELTQEKAAKDSLVTEKLQLIQTNNSLTEQLKEEQSVKEALLGEKMILTQELLEEKSIRKITEEEKLVLLAEKKQIEERLKKEGEVNKTLLEEKECLTQQLVEEKSARYLVEQEKMSLIKSKEEIQIALNEELAITQKLSEENNKCVEHQESLRQQLTEEIAAKQILIEAKEKLSQELIDEKSIRDEVTKEKLNLLAENESLKHELIETKTSQDVLVNDSNILAVEKESLTKSLSETKTALDQIESEKVELSDKLSKLNEKYESDLNSKHEELDTITAELKNIKQDLEKQEELNVRMSTAMTTGLDKLLLNLKKEAVSNEVLEKLISVEKTENMTIGDRCDLLINIADALTTELSFRKNLEKTLEHENTAMLEMRGLFQQKEIQVHELQADVKKLQQAVDDNKTEYSKQIEKYNTSLEAMSRDNQKLLLENQSLHNELTDVKLQLEIKVHSLKEKLIDNENLTDKLKKTYECQIDNLNIMITKLTNYLKDKTFELESLRKEKERLQTIIEDNNKAIKSLEEEVKSQKINQEKLISDFESERLVLKNMVTVTESVMEDQKVSLNKVINEHLKTIETLQDENKSLKESIDNEKTSFEHKIKEKDVTFETLLKELSDLKNAKHDVENDIKLQKDNLSKEIAVLKDNLHEKITHIEKLEERKKELIDSVEKCKDDIAVLEENVNDLNTQKDKLQAALNDEVEKLTETLENKTKTCNDLEIALKEETEKNGKMQEEIKEINNKINDLVKDKTELEVERNTYKAQLEEIQTKLNTEVVKGNEESSALKEENKRLLIVIEENKSVINNLEQLIKHELEQNKQLREDTTSEKLNLNNKCALLQEYQVKAETQLDMHQKETDELRKEVTSLTSKLESYEHGLKGKDALIAKLSEEKDAIINTLTRELVEEKATRERYRGEMEAKATLVHELREKMDELRSDKEVLNILRKENEVLVQAVGQRETFAAASQERMSSDRYSGQAEKDMRDLQHQVDNTTSDLTHSSMESIKTISDLEKIIHDKNRTITTLQSDITYMKSLMAESENKLLDVTKELEVSKENCQQLSSQLKKIVHQKNEEIAELKKQLSKMSVTENRASQIIKVSAKYQAIILKRIAEIKSNTVLKELTNFGNSNNCDNELRRSLNAGTITMEDLENFLETTDRHLRRCAEKQIALQKERDRLYEVNRINETEIISMKKFLTELSVSFKTFSSVKDLYTQKLTRVVSMQRTVRREILNLDGHITDATMCKLERGYAAIMQDLSECAMNLERWVERSISRTISPEKIKQAFSSETDRSSLAGGSFQNTSLEIQLEELENSFQKLLEEVVRAQKGEGAKDVQAQTVMEVRAEYEDKLNRMKAKMKQLYQEQIAVFKEKQKEEIALLEREVAKAREKLAESSKAYEEHIRALTTELWSVGEKFLMKKDEAEWLRRKQRSGSLMSLQHVHSSGLVPPPEEPSRPSDSHSLRSLPVHANNKREGRGLHMSDEEGEVFDNRWLKELSATPRRESAAGHRMSEMRGQRASEVRPGQRLSELQWRNSLCPPHLKSSYPAETQFAPAFDEDDIKSHLGPLGGRSQRKEVGITAYKKPGPPTPSKQAGRLSATDSELRESLRVEAEPTASRKTSTPSRIRALFRSNRSETVEGTPRSRRLSNIFRKK